jgi:hypothetical protein
MANQLIYGFHNLQDVKTRLVDEIGTEVITTAVEKAVAEQNRVLDSMMNLFVLRTTEYKLRFKSAVNARLQPLDENGRARPIKAYGHYDIELPILMGGSAWGVDYVASKKLTVQDANDATQTMLTADTNWVRDHILAGLLTNTVWQYDDDKHGTLNIKPLANGDTDKYQLIAGANTQGTAQHYLAQVAAISDAANPFKTIYKRLTEHPENSGDVIVLVASDLTDEIEGLANFKEKSDPDIQEGANASRLVGNLNARVPGTILGKVDKCWIVEWSQLPSGYMIATTTGGDRPLAMREDEEDSLRGFKKVAERNDHPFYESQYLRRAGFGGWNRVGALVYQVGSANYVIPAGYSSPMY